MSMHGMAMEHAAGAGAGPDLLPEWLGIAGAVMFLLIAGAHLGHLAMTSGERRPWHVLHVLMALGMASMYAPARVDPFPAGSELWQVVFVAAAAAAALRWLVGFARPGSGNQLWLSSAIDLGAMAYMWSPGSFQPAVTIAFAVPLAAEAAMWGLNAYRVVDRGTPLISWGPSATIAEGGAIAIPAEPSRSLVGGIDLSVSMTAMAVGMAYMLVAMQVMM